MKTNILLMSLVFFTLIGCSKVEKPEMTLGQYSKQITTAKGVLEKILKEEDSKKMHQIAIAVESARVINCTSVSEECNILGIVLNKIVKSTQNGPMSDTDRVEVYKLIGQFDSEAIKGHEILAKRWGDYIKARTDNKP